MERHGYIRDMMDVKILILYALARMSWPADLTRLYEVSFQDDLLSYFDLRIGLDELVETGHVALDEEERYTITERGRSTGAMLEDSLAAPVARRVREAAERFNERMRRESHIHTDVQPREHGDYTTRLVLYDGSSPILTLELMAPNERQAKKLERALFRRAEDVYATVMQLLLEEMEGKPGAEKDL